MTTVRVVLGAVPQLIEAIMRDVLMGTPDIEIINAPDGDLPVDYDVLVLNALEGHGAASGYTRPRPGAGIVMVAAEGRTACVFRRISKDLCLDDAAPIALKNAILLAAGRN